MNITHQATETVRLERRRGRCLSRYGRGEVPFDPSGAQGHGGDICGNAKVMTGKSDFLDPITEGRFQPGDFKQTDVFKSDRVS